MRILGMDITVLNWSIDSKKGIDTYSVKGKKGTIKEIVSSISIVKISGFAGEDQSKTIDLIITAPSDELNIDELL